MTYTKKQVSGLAAVVILGVVGGFFLSKRAAHTLRVRSIKKTQVPVSDNASVKDNDSSPGDGTLHPVVQY